MLKASALNIVIVIALVIAVICSSLIVVAYFYKIQDQKKNRYDNLSNNLQSGVNVLLASPDTSFAAETTFSLFGKDADSVNLKKRPWGIYDIGVAKSFIQKDTLYKVFTIANTIDSSRWAVLYLEDPDRPLSLSGYTTIRGDAFIPRAGVQPAYMDNKGYQGNKRLIIGARRNSEKQLPALDKALLKRLSDFRQQETTIADSLLILKDSIQVSFLQPTQYVDFKNKPQILKHKYYAGNLVLLSDTTLTIDSTTILKNILIFAKNVVFNRGFHGSCQLFAVDSIAVASRCVFNYPSCLGVLNLQPKLLVNVQAKITVDSNCIFKGIIFSYQKIDKNMEPMISVGKKTIIQGQVYSQGILELSDNCEIDGSIFTKSFLYRLPFASFGNYLVNTTIDSKALSPYYLTSKLLPVAKKRKRVLQWLEAN